MHFFRSLVVGIVLTALVQLPLEAQNIGSTDAQSQAAAAGASGAIVHSMADSSKSSTRVRQNPDDDSSFGEDPDNRLVSPFVKHLASDQRSFWTAPIHLRANDLKWIAPFAGITASLMAADSWTSKQIPLGRIETSKTISNYGLYSLIAAGGGSFVLGHVTRDDHMSETGLLSGEAAMNSAAITYLLKSATQRPRPYQSNGTGTFFQGGGSFPSEHAAIAWSIASVMAHEFPGTLSKVLAYGLATGISATRVTSQQHFTSDVIIGSALGWYFGRQVYRAHHDAHLGGAPWGDLLPESVGNKERDPENMGSSYVPLDSWIYPALERLIALGYIKTGYLGMRPWTRMECARMLEEADQTITDQDDLSDLAVRIHRDLNRELSPETARLNGAANVGASVDSVYVRATSISGPPLLDGYHFGQTIINDFGRPYAKGFNAATGITARAEAGPLAFYVRGEYQSAPARASYPFPVLQGIANADLTNPIQNGRTDVHRFDLLEGTVSFTWRNTRFSFGKQSQWLGPGESGALLMSNNAEPILMLKMDSVSPYAIPLISKLLGPARVEYFLGQLGGHQFEFNGNQLLGPGGISPQPFLDGGKVSFRPTANFEVGMGFTAEFAGPGLPFTFDNFIRTFYVHTQNTSTTTGNNPAKRIANADFTYRIPGMRNWLTVYADALTVDEVSPIGSTRATVNPGIYVPQFPKLHNLALRAEGLHEPLTNEFAPGFVYYGIRRYRSGYTNEGNLMGNWIGRAGRGAQAWLTYSFSPRSRLQFGYRLQEVSREFLQGGRSADYSADLEAGLAPSLSLRGFFQYEQWRFPVLASGTQTNVMTGFQLTFHPDLKIRR